MRARRPRRRSTPSILWPNGGLQAQPLLCKQEEGRGGDEPPQTCPRAATTFRDWGTAREAAEP